MIERIAIPVTIANGQSLSNAVDLYGYDLVAVAFPAAWTAADITFQTSPTNDSASVWRNVMDDAATPAEIVVGADASLHVIVADAKQRGFNRFIKVRSGPSAAPVAQGGDRIVFLVGRSPS